MTPSLRPLGLFSLSVLLLAGCHRHSERSAKIEFVVTPNPAEHTVAIQCIKTSTGVCHVVFPADASPLEADIKLSETSIFSNVSETTLYCAEAHKVSTNCKQDAVGSHRHTETKQYRSDDDAN